MLPAQPEAHPNFARLLMRIAGKGLGLDYPLPMRCASFAIFAVISSGVWAA